MSPAAYYNEHDPGVAAWLRELVKRGLIALGEVDERDIQAVQPGDLAGFTQCHFFAGIGGWSYALRLAGWADDTPVWTGSCPCQPFSAAGKGEGFADARHLWPDWFRLIRECRPDCLFGEQVASPAGLQWFDLVAADLESAGYAVGAADLPACSVGAPHIRQRLWFVADTFGNGRGRGGPREAGGAPGGVQGADGERERLRVDTGPGSAAVPCGMGDALCSQRRTKAEGRPDVQYGGHAGREEAAGRQRVAGPLRGFWADAEWLPCRDGKARPTQSGIAPLASGAPARVVRLRGYGNCLNAPLAAEFIAAYLEAREGAVML